MSKELRRKTRRTRRTYGDDLKAEAVQMLLDGHSATSVAENLGLRSVSLLYRWKGQLLKKSGPAATALDSRVQQLEAELQRVERERDILKKSLGHFQPEDVNEVYAVIQELAIGELKVAAVCDALKVSRSAYYAWRQYRCGPRALENNRLRPTIRSIFWEHKRRYGARRIAMELTARHQPCGRRRASRLMNEMGLTAIQPRSFKPRTTDSRHTLGYSPNLLLGVPPPTALNQLWVGDITYVPLVTDGFLYLALLMDRYSRRIVAWALQDHMQESLVLAALRAAIGLRQPKPGLIHHTDRGGQYAAAGYRRVLARAGMLQSMSRANDCYDNAFMESCFGTIKTELEMKPYSNTHVARKEIPDYIRYYNTRRRHSALNYLTPEYFESGDSRREL